MSDIIEFLKDYRVILLLILVIGSISVISFYGVQEGLDLRGGSLVQLHLDQPVDKDTMSKVTTILDKRLNILGVYDIDVRESGDQDVIIAIAGVKPEEVAHVVGTPGKFEAKIENQTVFTGADIVNVKPYQVTGTVGNVPFVLTIDSAQKFAQAAKGKANIPVDMYLDDKLMCSPLIKDELAQGIPQPEVNIEIPASSKDSAMKQAKDTSVLLQSGALPVKVEIIGVKSVSADLGNQFEKGALIAGLLAIFMVSLVVYLRYRTPILVLPIIFTTLAELLLILGTASLIHWNIDLAAIAGILAAIGTGVDDQIIITDEVLKKDKSSHQKKKSTRKNTGLNIR